jgi:hypothetical protein
MKTVTPLAAGSRPVAPAALPAAPPAPAGGDPIAAIEAHLAEIERRLAMITLDMSLNVELEIRKQAGAALAAVPAHRPRSSPGRPCHLRLVK